MGRLIWAPKVFKLMSGAICRPRHKTRQDTGDKGNGGHQHDATPSRSRLCSTGLTLGSAERLAIAGCRGIFCTAG